MKIIGIICEYNPMHLGHLYQIKEIKKKYPDSIIIAVLCGCFTQRGDICIINKWNKTNVALDNDIDLVIELPFVYATQAADIFAKGALKILNYLKVDTIVFGSESDDILKFEKIVEVQLFNKDYDTKVKEYMNLGVSYPTAMSKALIDILGYTVSSPNDLLAISYIKEIIKNKYNIDYVSIKRTNGYHDYSIKSDIISASAIRKMILKGDDISKYIAFFDDNYIYRDLTMNRSFDYLKYKIISEDISNIQTVDEGIDKKLKSESWNCNNLEDFILKVKSKRYTYNKITRMFLHILTNFTKDEAKLIDIDYIRLLGFSINGQKYLNTIKKEIEIPIITNYKKNISKVLDIEMRVNYIYAMLVNDNKLIDYEFRHKPIIKK